MGNNRYPNLSWFPKPKDWPDDFDGHVTAQNEDGTYVIKPISHRIPGITNDAWWDKEVFVATFGPKTGDSLMLTAAPTTRREAQSLVKAHQRRACDAREKNNQ